MDLRECGGGNDVNHGLNPVGRSVKLSSCWSLQQSIMIIEGNLFIDKGRSVFVQKRGAGRGGKAQPEGVFDFLPRT